MNIKHRENVKYQMRYLFGKQLMKNFFYEMCPFDIYQYLAIFDKNNISNN